ncbi:hypothetical protein ABT186_23125 [Streptomyces sp. NPDC001634]|uniref:hypothetical protein n=1 Tax=Streptomyces sp. NPDC001634 TaxID=3154390 RepID=UPI003317081F
MTKGHVILTPTISVVFDIEMETERKLLCLEAEQLLGAAELMMRRAAGHAGRDAKADMRCSQIAAELANDAYEF